MGVSINNLKGEQAKILGKISAEMKAINADKEIIATLESK